MHKTQRTEGKHGVCTLSANMRGTEQPEPPRRSTAADDIAMLLGKPVKERHAVAGAQKRSQRPPLVVSDDRTGGGSSSSAVQPMEERSGGVGMRKPVGSRRAAGRPLRPRGPAYEDEDISCPVLTGACFIFIFVVYMVYSSMM